MPKRQTGWTEAKISRSIMVEGKVINSFKVHWT